MKTNPSIKKNNQFPAREPTFETLLGSVGWLIQLNFRWTHQTTRNPSCRTFPTTTNDLHHMRSKFRIWGSAMRFYGKICIKRLTIEQWLKISTVLYTKSTEWRQENTMLTARALFLVDYHANQHLRSPLVQLPSCYTRKSTSKRHTKPREPTSCLDDELSAYWTGWIWSYAETVVDRLCVRHEENLCWRSVCLSPTGFAWWYFLIVDEENRI